MNTQHCLHFVFSFLNYSHSKSNMDTSAPNIFSRQPRRQSSEGRAKCLVVSPGCQEADGTIRGMYMATTVVHGSFEAFGVTVPTTTQIWGSFFDLKTSPTFIDNIFFYSIVSYQACTACVLCSDSSNLDCLFARSPDLTIPLLSIHICT